MATQSAKPAAELRPMEKDSGVFAAISYVFGPIVALVIYLIRKEDRFLRFHALQSMVFDLVLIICWFALVPILWLLMAGGMLVGALSGVAAPGAGGMAAFGFVQVILVFVWVMVLMGGLAAFAVKLYAAYSAYQEKAWKIPLVGKFVEGKI